MNVPPIHGIPDSPAAIGGRDLAAPASKRYLIAIPITAPVLLTNVIQ